MDYGYDEIYPIRKTLFVTEPALAHKNKMRLEKKCYFCKLKQKEIIIKIYTNYGNPDG